MQDDNPCRPSMETILSWHSGYRGTLETLSVERKRRIKSTREKRNKSSGGLGEGGWVEQSGFSLALGNRGQPTTPQSPGTVRYS